VRSILNIDTERQWVYYTSTKGHSTENHVYNTSYVTLEAQALVDDSIATYWDASFSSAGGYCMLSYGGPDVPYQELYAANETVPLRTVTSNARPLEADSKLQPSKHHLYRNRTSARHRIYFECHDPVPTNFDPTKNYPVILTPYGGPGAQEVAKTFKAPSWIQYISSDPELEYITYTVDNRGTGCKGCAFRASVTEKLGVLEAKNQIWTAIDLISRYEFVDADHIALWGW
jgi:dipeptidyl-peptidase-4